MLLSGELAGLPCGHNGNVPDVFDGHACDHSIMHGVLQCIQSVSLGRLHSNSTVRVVQCMLTWLFGVRSSIVYVHVVKLKG